MRIFNKITAISWIAFLFNIEMTLDNFSLFSRTKISDSKKIRILLIEKLLHA